MNKKSDIIIIGSGPGGYRAAAYAAKHGKKVTIFEADLAGGTCLNRGCIPTKALCRNAEIIDSLRKADSLGLTNMSYKLDFTKIIERKDSIIEQLRSGVESLMSDENITMIKAHACLTGNHTVVAAGEEYTAENIIIATGSRPRLPNIEGITLPGVLNSDDLLNIKYIPKRLCIIGSGVIGMEFASVFNSFGSEVTVIEFLKESLPTIDSDIAKRLRQTIAKRGVTFNMQSAVKQISEAYDNDGKRQLTVCFNKKDKTETIDTDIVLVATGRDACTDNIGLESLGVVFDNKGIATDENYMTSIQGIYAIGDVNGKCMLAHAATFQGIHVINNILGTNDDIKMDIMPSAIFTHPEAASVGLSEDQCKIHNIGYTCHKAFFRANGKALAIGETDGMIKLITDTQDKIIGCHMFGAHSSDMVQEVAVLMNQGATLTQLRDIIHIHPTLSEALHDITM